MQSTNPSRTYDFIQSIGVCAHIDDGSSSYAQNRSIGQMAYLGINNMRVNAPGNNLNGYWALGRAGIKFDVLSNTTDLKQQIGWINSIASSVAFVEGPDEVNSLPISYQGLTGAAAADAYQKDLYAAVHADPLLKNAAVLPFSLSVGGSLTGFGDVTAYADYANVHGYASGGVPPDYMLGYAVSSVTTVVGKPVIMTETGNYTLNDGNSGVTQDVQAKWLMDTLLENSATGVVKTYLYQLEDNYTDPVNDPENHYGLYTVNGTPKQLAVDIHDLTTILADKGAAAATFTPAALNIGITGLNPNYGWSKAYAKSNGSYDVALWSEPQFFSSSTGVASAVVPSAVTVALDGTYNVSVFDPVVGTSAISTAVGVSSIQVSLGTDPLIVQLTSVAAGSGGSGGSSSGSVAPTPLPANFGAGPDTVALSLSEDASQGDAQFTIAIDGKAIYGAHTVTASNSAGYRQSVLFHGTWGAGPHSVGVTFINGLDGAASTGRNLYVNQVTYDGQAATGAPVALTSTGTDIFAVSGTAAIVAGPKVITMHMAEDAWQGDAQYSLSIDGNLVQPDGAVTASNGQAQSQADVFNVALGSGQHDIAVTFLNDAYGGSGGTDRNLYIKGIDLNGTPLSGASATLLSNGTAHFPVTVS